MKFINAAAHYLNESVEPRFKDRCTQTHEMELLGLDLGEYAKAFHKEEAESGRLEVR